MDFTLFTLKNLLGNLVSNRYHFSTFYEQLACPHPKSITLRHDVDLKPENSLATARLENSLNLNGTYFFRIIPQTFKPDTIRRIAELGHEIGYHYEDMDLVSADNLDRHIDLAYESFQRNLESLRKIVPIKTICMHGSPRSKFDNKLIWTKYNYRDLELLGEPYFDIDFDECLYLTDTGRRWNGYKVSVRDKVNSKYKFDLKSTQDVISAIPKFPDKIMITIHPQRWDDKLIPWTKELISQNIKNIVKRVLINQRVT